MRRKKEEHSERVTLSRFLSASLSPSPPVPLSSSLRLSVSHLSSLISPVLEVAYPVIYGERQSDWCHKHQEKRAVSKPYKHIILTIIIYYINLFTWGHEHEEKRHNRHRKSRHGNTTRLSSFLLGYRSTDDDDD